MNKLNTYLVKLQENMSIENPLAYEFRIKNNYLWLYHGIKKDNIESIKKYGLNPKFHGSSHNAPIEHPSDKNSLSYSTNKSYAGIYGDKEYVLLCKVPNDELFFAIRKKWINDFLDEYQSPKLIKLKDILFPEDKKYIEIENNMKYLQYGNFYKK